ncbi:MAG: hypothetical protein V7746_07065 [Halioglobus sp.]
MTLPLVLSLLLIYSGVGLFQQNLTYTAVDTELSFWGRGKYQPDAQTIALTGASINALLRHNPRHPDYLASQAYYTAWQGYRALDGAERERLNEQALASQYQALLARPAERQGWLTMLEYGSRITSGEPMRQLAQSRLQALALD